MLGKYLDNVRNKGPRVHNITNYVTVNDVANVLLACGGSPIMADDPGEVEDITETCDALTINIGTISQRRIESMLLAGKRANERNHVVLLDPVAVGASRMRMEAVKRLIKELKIDVIRGNMSEIKAIVLGSETGNGVDADLNDAVTEENLNQAVDFIKEAAKRMQTILVASGELTLVSDGNQCFVIWNGRQEMRSVTGTGCQLSAMTTAFVAANPEHRLEAATAACVAMGVAGETGWMRMKNGDGNATYRERTIDAIYNMSSEIVDREAAYEIR